MATNKDYETAVKLLHGAGQKKAYIMEHEKESLTRFIVMGKKPSATLNKEDVDIVCRYIGAALAENLALETILEG